MDSPMNSDDEKYTTQWEDLPIELRTMCVEKLNFKDKMRMRRLSRTDKDIVERVKEKFNAIEMYMISKQLVLTAESERDGDLYSSDKVKFIREKARRENIDKNELYVLMMKAVMKFGNVRRAVVKILDIDTTTIGALEETGRFKFPRATFSGCGERFMHQFLENYEPGAECFTFHNVSGRAVARVFRDTLLIPMLLSVGTLQFQMPANPPVHVIPNFWIEMDCEIGKRCLFEPDMLDFFTTDSEVKKAYDSVFQSVIDHFGERIIEKSKNVIRLATNNPTKHILLTGFFVRRGGNCDRALAVFEIIAANLQPKDYKKKHGWID